MFLYFFKINSNLDYRDLFCIFTLQLHRGIQWLTAELLSILGCFTLPGGWSVTQVWPVLQSEVVVCNAVTVDARRFSWFSWLPGAESVLPHPLLLQQAGVLQLDGAGDEAHLAALLHQTSDPPVIVVLLHLDGQASVYQYELNQTLSFKHIQRK